MTENVRIARKKLTPRRKFDFKFSPKPVSKDLNKGEASSSFGRGEKGQFPLSDGPRSTLSKAGVSVSSLVDSRYIPILNDMQSSSVSLSNIRRSVIDLTAKTTKTAFFASIFVNDVAESLLICGESKGAAHLTGIRTSTVLLKSRQVRVHASQDCVFYLHCSSHPIIEDCSNVRFAPLPRILVIVATPFKEVCNLLTLIFSRA